ncbi:MAG: hypothetical protein HY050_03220 [Actinobacteria bacterium]|nr:hypothetical protein [Actinomycetota bacterium]
MTAAAIVIGILTAIAVGRVIFLNAEIRTLDAASRRFGNLTEGWKSVHSESAPIPASMVEAQTEFDWLINARDSKKEVRTVWVGGALLSLILLVSAVVEINRN